ncbi:MAG: MFS transporter, partial [Actinomycetota bacterium]|nr:MFS transporter [Actinomycetota bacterium]
MAVTTADSVPARSNGGLLAGIKNRQLEHYPDTGPRVLQLALVVLVTVALYYEAYVGGSVSTLLLGKLHMSFTFYVYTIAIGNAFGAFASLGAGLADRLGRAQLVVAGLLVTGVATAFILPAMTSKWPFTIVAWIVGVVEGIVLVATPALVRDFSPQVGRAQAMGFWTMGPVLGSLVVSVVGTNTINAHTNWPYEYRICGIAGIVVFVIAFLFLRELSPGLRDQLMVSEKDRVLIEAKAKGIDIEESLKRPFGQLLRPDIVISALAVSILLLVYYTAVGFGTIYFQTIFSFNLKDANGLANWNWISDAVALVVVGVLSDRLRVRKPFMIAGAVGTAVMLVVFLEQFGHHPGYYKLALIISLLTIFLACAYCPWMASYTETVESYNPALTATGLAIWGWIIRVVVFASFLLLPQVVNAVTPVVTYGATVQGLATKYAPQLATAAAIHPDTLAALTANPSNSTAIGQAVSQISATQHVSSAQAVQNLVALSKVPKADLGYLTAHGKA